MNAEFNWWLLIVGLVVGAGLVWFVAMDARRRDVDVDEQERPREALWLSRTLADEGHDVSPEAAERLLLLHRSYLEAPPPDEPPEPMAMGPDIRPAADQSGPPSSSATSAGAASELASDDRVSLQRRAPDVRQ